MIRVHLHLDGWTPGGHGLLRALPRSYQVTPEIPNPATSDTAKGGQAPTGRQPETESARRRTGTISAASDITDTTNHNSKPESDSTADSSPSGQSLARSAGRGAAGQARDSRPAGE